MADPAGIDRIANYGLIIAPEFYKRDYIIFDGIKSPGRAVVSPISEPREFQDSQGFAMSGAVTRFAGNKLSEFDVTFIMWEPETHLKEWAQLHALFKRPDPGKRAKIIHVVHPYLANAGIRQVYCVDQIGPYIDEKGEYKGAFIAQVKFKEARSPKPINPKPREDIKSMDRPKSASDEVDDAIKAETEKLKNLKAQL